MNLKTKFFNLFKCDKTNEDEDITIQSFSSRNLEQYFKQRIEYKINIYDKLAKRNKWLFWLTTSISMVCAAVVPALINQGECYKLLATILSLIVTIMVGFQGVFHPREHWRNYDRVSATLRREEMMFSTEAGEYEKQLDDKQRLRLLVQRVEDFIAREREETIIMRTSDKEKT